MLLVLGLTPGCRADSASTSPDGAALGNIDARPFVPVSAFGRKQGAELEVLAFERAVGRDEGCAAPVPALGDDGDRMLELRLEWPAPAGSEFWTEPTDKPPSMKSAAAFFHVKRGLGETSSRARGSIRAETVSAAIGVVSLELGTANEADAVAGLLRGSLEFTLCP